MKSAAGIELLGPALLDRVAQLLAALALPFARRSAKVPVEIRALIRRMADGNPDWGAPRIHAQAQKLGFAVSERTVARYLRRIRRRGGPAKRWLAFLRNRREVTAAFDFFTVPTFTFNLLYCFFVIEHSRRKVGHFNVTRHPAAEWRVQHLWEAFPGASPYRSAIFETIRSSTAT